MTRTYRTAVGRLRGTIAWAVVAAALVPGPAMAAQQEAALRVTGPEVLVAAPDNSTGVFGSLRYSRHAGTEMLLIYDTERASDVADEGYCRWSVDNGKTWSQPVTVYHRNKPGQDASVELPSGRYAKCWDYSNGKRYPLVIGEVDRATGLLRRRSLTVVADRRPDQHEGIQFSNFSCLEDRETGEIVVLVPHYYPSGRWMSGELCRYRVQVPRIGG